MSFSFLTETVQKALGFRQNFLQITGDAQLLSSLEGSSETERSSVCQLSGEDTALDTSHAAVTEHGQRQLQGGFFWLPV